MLHESAISSGLRRMHRHRTEGVKSAFNGVSKLAMIPGGLTSKLQPLDISVNRSFKSNMRKRWERWMVDSIHEHTRTGKLKRASYKEITEWIIQSWNDVSSDCIIGGFRRMMGDVSEDQEVAYPEDGQEETLIGDVNSLIGVFTIESDSDFDGFD